MTDVEIQRELQVMYSLVVTRIIHIRYSLSVMLLILFNTTRMASYYSDLKLLKY